MNEVVWVTPLLLMPGIGLIIMSTASRFATMHSEMHHWLDREDGVDPDLVQNLLQRARLFRNALLALYGAIASLSLGSLFGGVFNSFDHWHDFGSHAVTGLTGAGVLMTFFAVSQLMLESRLLLRVIEIHSEELRRS